jgi:septum formation protein
VSEVRFCKLSAEAIQAYCNSGTVRQGRRLRHPGHGGQFIEHISGSHSGIMGLPCTKRPSCSQAGLPLL